MATVAESLLITLGLDTRGVKKGSEDTEKSLKNVENQANKTGKELEGTAKKGKEFFSTLEAGLLSLIAAVGAAHVVKDFFQDAIVGMADLGRKSQYLHMSAATLQAWGNVAASMGGTAAEAGASLQSLASDFIRLKVTGDSSFAPVLNRLGIDMKQFRNNADPLSSLLLALADKFKQLGPQEALFFGHKLGFSDSLITALRQGRESLTALLTEFRRASGATDANTKSAQQAQLAWQLIKSRFVGIRDEIEGRLTPVVQNLLEKFADWIDKNKELITSKILSWIESFANWLKSIDWNAVGDGLTKIVKGFVAFISAIGKGVDAIGGWKNALLGLGAIMSLNMLRPITSIVGALGRMVPLLISARAGFVGLAAAGGAFIGSKISEKLEGTRAGDVIGKTLTSFAALFSSDAKNSVEAQNYADSSDKERATQRASYLLLNKSQKEEFDKEHPSVSRMIKSGLVAQKATQALSDQAYYAQHSRIAGDNATLFAGLENKAGLPAGLLNAIFQQESSGGKRLVSPVGAKGPFQFMDATAAQFGLKGNDVYDLDKSATAAALYLRSLMSQFHGSVPFAVAAFNAGPGNVQKYGGIPPFAETQKYVANIIPQLGQTGLTYGSTDNSRSAQVSIGSVNVNAPQATDARGVAMGIAGELQRNSLLAQATTGLQ